MLYALCLLAGLLAGVVIAAARLRGDGTTMDALRAVVLSGGGPRPSKPR